MSSLRGSAPSRVLAWGLPLAAGAALRGWNLRDQILVGDEHHAVEAALSRSTGEILRTWTFAGADYGVPLAALYRCFLDAGLPLSEGVLRAPVLIGSLAAIVVVPLLLQPRLGPRAALCLAWLLALSPLLVLYGRMARSYGLLVAASATAFGLLDRWWRTGSRGAALGVVLLSAVAVWLHLGAAPFVAGMFLWVLSESLWLTRAAPVPASTLGRTPREVVALGLGTALAVAAVLAPAASSLRELLALHGGGALPSPGTWLDAFRTLLGHGSGAVALALAATTLRGGAVLGRRAPGFLRGVAWVIAVHAVGLVLLAPQELEELPVLTRYLLVALPPILALLAVGLTEPLGTGPVSGPQRVAVAAGLAVVLATGPLAAPRFRRGSWAHAPVSVAFLLPPDRLAGEVPAFYRELGARCGQGCNQPVVELPFLNVAHHAFALYQETHGQRVLVASVSRSAADDRLALRNTLSRRFDGLLASDARWLVVHTDLGSEEARVDSALFQFRERLERLDDLWRGLRLAGAQTAREWEERFGPPDASDAHLRVWDLARLRTSPAAGD